MSRIFIAAVLLVASAAANAVPATLNTVLAGRADFPSSPFTILSGSALDAEAWEWDGTTVSTDGVLNAGVAINNTPLFNDVITGMINGNGTADAAGFSCVDGLFATLFGVSVCGGYNFGDNGMNESTFTYDEAGLTWSRTIGGDDFITDDPRDITGWDMTASVMGNLLILETADYFSMEDGPCVDEMDEPTGLCDSAGLRMEFTIVPVPAAVWLFGSALGLLGWVRRRA